MPSIAGYGFVPAPRFLSQGERVLMMLDAGAANRYAHEMRMKKHEYDVIARFCNPGDMLWNGVGYEVARAIDNCTADSIQSRRRDVIVFGPGYGDDVLAIRGMMPDCRIAAVDSDAAMIQHLHNKNEGSRFAGDDGRPLVDLTLHVEDALGFLRRDQNHQGTAVASSTWMLHNLSKEERREFFRLLYEWLPSRGAFVLGDKVYDDDPHRAWVQYNCQKQTYEHFLEEHRPQLLRQVQAHEEADWNVRLTRRELRNISSDTGFRANVRDMFPGQLHTVLVFSKG
jgi:hypothetical protein